VARNEAFLPPIGPAHSPKENASLAESERRSEVRQLVQNPSARAQCPGPQSETRRLCP
jgi:hypothetical protein